MGRMNIYLPDDLAEEARLAGLNVSRLTQDAIRQALRGERTTQWLRALEARHASGELGVAVDAAAIEEALRGAKDDLEGGVQP
jgi:post-segregation antitoxin (ccd killing protein)